MELHELLETVTDEASFVAFARALLNDLRTNGQSWENGSIEHFLDAGASWAEATNVGASQGLAQASAWRRAATFLYCGKIYE
jgi:hypothetical protein